MHLIIHHHFYHIHGQIFLFQLAAILLCGFLLSHKINTHFNQTEKTNAYINNNYYNHNNLHYLYDDKLHVYSFDKLHTVCILRKLVIMKLGNKDSKQYLDSLILFQF